MQVMTGQRALWSRQRPPEQKFHSSAALTLMTAAVTKMQEHGGELAEHEAYIKRLEIMTCVYSIV